MIVKESISFERFKDPKKALGLKAEPEIIEHMENIYYVFQMYNYVYVLVNELVWNIYYRGDISNWKNGLIREIVSEVEMYGRNAGDYKFSYIENALLEKAKKIIKEDIKERMKKNLTESISFKRYRDPKTALGLNPYQEIIDIIKIELDHVVALDEIDIEFEQKEKILKIWTHDIRDAIYQKMKFKLEALQSSDLFDKILMRRMIDEDRNILGFAIELLPLKESIGFERYKDPKRALGFDYYGEIIDLIKEKLDFQFDVLDSDEFVYNPVKKILDINFIRWMSSAKYMAIDIIKKLSQSNLKNKIDFKVKYVKHDPFGIKIQILPPLRESIGFERYRDPKIALGLTPYVGAVLKIPNSYARNNHNYLRKSHRNSHVTGYELWTVTRAEKIEDNLLRIDMKHSYSNNTVTSSGNLLMTLNQFEKFRDI